MSVPNSRIYVRPSRMLWRQTQRWTVKSPGVINTTPGTCRNWQQDSGVVYKLVSNDETRNHPYSVVVIVLGTGNPVRADRRCLTGDSGNCQTIVRQVGLCIRKFHIREVDQVRRWLFHATILKRLWCHIEICIRCLTNQQHVDPPSHN